MEIHGGQDRIRSHTIGKLVQSKVLLDIEKLEGDPEQQPITD